MARKNINQRNCFSVLSTVKIFVYGTISTSSPCPLKYSLSYVKPCSCHFTENHSHQGCQWAPCWKQQTYLNLALLNSWTNLDNVDCVSLKYSRGFCDILLFLFYFLNCFLSAFVVDSSFKCWCCSALLCTWHGSSHPLP